MKNRHHIQPTAQPHPHSFAARLSEAAGVNQLSDDPRAAEELFRSVAASHPLPKPPVTEKQTHAEATAYPEDLQSFIQRLSNAVAIAELSDGQSPIVSNPIEPYSNPTVIP